MRRVGVKAALGVLSAFAVVSTVLCLCFFYLVTLFFFDAGVTVTAVALAWAIWAGPILVPILMAVAWSLFRPSRECAAVVLAVAANYPLIWPGAIAWHMLLQRHAA